MTPDEQPSPEINQAPVNSGPAPIISANNTPAPKIVYVGAHWRKQIPSLNYIFMGISVGLLLLIDTPMVSSNPGMYGSFYYMMLGVLGIFIFFLLIENFIFKKLFYNSLSKFDTGIAAVITVRNLIFILNFIPFIQLFGLAGLFYGGIPILVVYIVLMTLRYKETKSTPQSSPLMQ